MHVSSAGARSAERTRKSKTDCEEKKTDRPEFSGRPAFFSSLAGESALADCTGRTDTGTGSAADACIRIDLVLTVALSDRAYRTFAGAGAAAYASIVNYICHKKYLL